MEKDEKIPKIIHYCWFGGNQLPEDAQKCILSWKKYCPDYEILEWNEENYNVNTCRYIKEAYQAKKWAFVSDYARFDILFRYGGIYLDTDVELVGSIDDIVAKGAFLGEEQCDPGPLGVAINPGIGMGFPRGHWFCKEMLDQYEGVRFLNEDGSINRTTIVSYATNLLKKHGLSNVHNPTFFKEIWVYPWEYFCPMKYPTGELTITSDTRSIHHYSATWFSEEEQKALRIIIKTSKWFGPAIGRKLGRIYSFPYRVRMKIKLLGIRKTLRFAMNKLLRK